jgi:hypothetical protein
MSQVSFRHVATVIIKNADLRFLNARLFLEPAWLMFLTITSRGGYVFLLRVDSSHRITGRATRSKFNRKLFIVDN